jgi:hypothetical protein
MVLLAANLTNIALIVSIYGPAELIHFFSNWAVCATSIYLAVAIVARRNYQNLSLLAWHHILFELSLIMNIVVVSVFWTILYE